MIEATINGAMEGVRVSHRSAAFAEFWNRRANDFPMVSKNEAAVIFYGGLEAGLDISHQVRMEGIATKFKP